MKMYLVRIINLKKQNIRNLYLLPLIFIAFINLSCTAQNTTGRKLMNLSFTEEIIR